MENKLWESVMILRDRGWTKGTRGMEQGPHCAMGALDAAHGVQVPVFQGQNSWPEIAPLAEVVREQYPDRVYSEDMGMGNVGAIVSFNNHPDTTFEDVERAFEKAAVNSYATS